MNELKPCPFCGGEATVKNIKEFSVASMIILKLLQITMKIAFFNICFSKFFIIQKMKQSKRGTGELKMYKMTYNGEYSAEKRKAYETTDKFILKDTGAEIPKINLEKLIYKKGEFYMWAKKEDKIYFMQAIKSAYQRKALWHYNKWQELMKEAEKL